MYKLWYLWPFLSCWNRDCKCISFNAAAHLRRLGTGQMGSNNSNRTWCRWAVVPYRLTLSKGWMRQNGDTFFHTQKLNGVFLLVMSKSEWKREWEKKSWRHSCLKIPMVVQLHTSSPAPMVQYRYFPVRLQMCKSQSSKSYSFSEHWNIHVMFSM